MAAPPETSPPRPAVPFVPSRPGDWLTPARFAGLLALLWLLELPGLFTGQSSLFYRDYGVIAYPTIHHYRASLSQGEFPFWNPFSNCGVPFMAQWGTMTLYPGALFYLLLPLPWSLGIFCLAHVVLAGVGMYQLARERTGHPGAASLAGLAFAFNGLMRSCLLWPNYLVALGWLPWVVWLVGRGRREGGRRLVYGALAAALQVLAGVPEIVVFTWLICGTFWVVDCQRASGRGARGRGSRAPARDRSEGVRPADDKGGPPAAAATGGAATGGPPIRPPVANLGWLGQLGRLALILALALGLCAMQLLPFLDLVAQSQRTGGVDAGKWGLPLSGWVNLVLPIAHAFRSSQGVCFRAGQEFFSSIYAGVGVVALAGWALWRARGRTVTALAILALLGLIMAWGERTPLFRIMRWCIPACGMARYPVKFMILSGFSFSLIAAYGLAHIWGRRSSSRGRATLGMGLGTAVMLAGIGALVAWAWSTRTPSDLWPATAINAGVRCAFLVATVALAAILSERHEPRFEAVVGLALLLFTWADFRTHLPVQNPTIPARNLSAAPPRSDALPKLGDGRVFITPEAEARLLQSGIEDAQADFVGKRLALWSHLNLLERVPKVNGSATLQLREEAQVQSWLYAPDSTNRVAWLDFLGATWASSSTNPVDWVRRPTALPLVTAGQSPEYRAEDKPPAAIGLEAFDGRRTVSVPEGARAEAGKAGATRALVTKTRWSANRIEFEVQADAPAWAVVAQSYAPGWRAWVNGQPARLWRVNHAFQGLPVPAGASRVRLVYRERGFLPGLGISAGALLICGLLWFRERGVSATAPSASPATPAPAAEETPIPGAEERPQEPPGS